MREIFEQAGVDASDMTSEIKDIASGVGVNAAAVLKDMASQQNQMLGLSKEEIKILWEGNEYFSGINKFFKYLEKKNYKKHYKC